MASSNSNSLLPASGNLDRQVTNVDISDHESSTDGQTTRTYNVSAKNVNISAGHRQTRPGTLAYETLKLRISDAKKTFITTQSLKQVQRKLRQSGHVTICGASGEGKTSMALMLARDYVKKGYEVVFVEKVDAFDYNEFISSAHKMILIVDDVFGTVGLSTDTSHLTNLINSLKIHIEDCKQKSANPQTTQKSKTGSRHQTDRDEHLQGDQKETKDIRVVFTSKTYNFKDGISKLQHQSLSMFTRDTVVDLTTNKDYNYSDEEKIAMFDKHKSLHPTTEIEAVSTQHLLNLDNQLFGFPLTCRLYFEFAAFRGSMNDFFKRPLFYLRIELNNLLSHNNNQTAAFILMLLCEDQLDLARLELQGRDKKTDQMFNKVKEVVPSATRSGIATAARSFRGTFFSGDDTLRFAHSSIYDACACAMYNFNPSFVLQYCSYDFLYERVRSGSEAKVTDHLHFLFVSDNYHHLIATRLVSAMKHGLFSRTVTHPLLKNEHFAQHFFQKLQSGSFIKDSNWIRLKDKGKGFMYWTVQGYSVKLVCETESLFDIQFTQNEILEAIEGCVEKDKLGQLKFLLGKLENPKDKTFQKLLWLSGEHGSWEMGKYLLREGAKVIISNEKKENFIHIACKSGRSNILKSFIGEIGALVTRTDYLSALSSVDSNDRTPAMLAALYGSWDCFTQIRSDSDLELQDCNHVSAIHLIASRGNTDLLQHVLTPANINKRGQNGSTPVMYAAVYGQQSVFELLASSNADLTLTDDDGSSLLHLACQGGNVNIVQQVLTPANINKRGQHGWTSVMYAAVYGQQSV